MNEKEILALIHHFNDPTIDELSKEGGQVLEERGIRSDPNAQRTLETRRRRERGTDLRPVPLVI